MPITMLSTYDWLLLLTDMSESNENSIAVKWLHNSQVESKLVLFYSLEMVYIEENMRYLWWTVERGTQIKQEATPVVLMGNTQGFG